MTSIQSWQAAASAEQLHIAIEIAKLSNVNWEACDDPFLIENLLATNTHLLGSQISGH